MLNKIFRNLYQNGSDLLNKVVYKDYHPVTKIS